MQYHRQYETSSREPWSKLLLMQPCSPLNSIYILDIHVYIYIYTYISVKALHIYI